MGALLCTAGIYLGDAATDQASLAPLVTLPAVAITFAAGWIFGIAFSVVAGFVFGTIGHPPTMALPNALVLAASFAVVVVLFNAARSLYVRSAAFQAELVEAKSVYDTMFVDKQKAGSRWRSHIIHTPLRETGGDFYALQSDQSGEELEVFIADVAGKGVRASMLLSALKTLWHANRSEDPADKLTLLNQQWQSVCGDEMFCTAWYARLSPAGVVRYANAGHERPFLLRSSGSLEQLDVSGIVLGVTEQPDYSSATVQLAPGDALLLYTDGLAELMDAGVVKIEDFFRDFEAMRWKIATMDRRDDVLAILLEYKS